MKRLNQTESPVFVILCFLCFQRQSFFTFIKHTSDSVRMQRLSLFRRSLASAVLCTSADAQGFRSCWKYGSIN